MKREYVKRICNVGYLGEGIYKATENGKQTKAHSVWRGIIQRCYNPKYHERQPTYIGCSVDSSWHNFQNFAKWYEENYYELENEKTELDKDFLVKGNKVYSKDTCILLPKTINLALISKQVTNTSGYTGVVWHNASKKYMCQIKKYGKLYCLGYFNNPLDASIVYEYEKNKYLTELMQSYKSKLPKRIYKKIINTLIEQDIKIVA